MDSSDLGKTLKPVSPYTLKVIVWTFVSVTAAFLIARLSIQLHVFRRVCWGDGFVIAAWTQLLVSSILWRLKMAFTQRVTQVTDGTDANLTFDSEDMSFFHYFLALLVLFYTTLWSVKYSFLIFFHQLHFRTRAHRIWWWIVFGMTTAALIASLGDIPFRCLLTSPNNFLQNCEATGSISSFENIIYGNMIIDVATDLLILSIPVTILWNVRISTKQKLILFALFSVTVLIMIVAVVRAMVIRWNHEDQMSSLGWIFTWNFIEMSVAIMIACVASFRQFFVGKATNPEVHRKSDPGRILTSVSSLFRRLHRSRNSPNHRVSCRGPCRAVISRTTSVSDESEEGSNKPTAGSIYVHSTIDVASEEVATHPTSEFAHFRFWTPEEQV